MRFTQYLSEQAIAHDVWLHADLPIVETIQDKLDICISLWGSKRQIALNAIVETVKSQLIDWAKSTKDVPDCSILADQIMANPNKIAKNILLLIQSSN